MRIFLLITLFSSFYLASATTSDVQAQDEKTTVINMDSTFQTIRGFGAAGITGWRPDITNSELETAFGTGDDQLGFTIFRLRIPPQENHKENKSAWSANLSMAVEAYNMGYTIIASPWTPPASMKTNNNLIGGRLREDAYDDFAEYLNDFAIYMEENGAPVYAVSVQNEPDIQVNYESCDYTPEEMLTFMRDYAGSITATKVMAPESFQYRRVMSDAILNDSLATANTDLIAGHIYGGGNADYPLAEEKGKERWMTEYLIGNESSANTWELAEQAARVLDSAMGANFNAYIWWYMVRFYSVIHDGTDPVDDGFNDRGTKGSVTKLGYVTSHYSKFIRPGYQRIYAAGPVGRTAPRLHITAYKDTVSSNLVIVALNDNNNDHEIGFVVQSGASERFEQYRTDEDLDVEQLEDIEVTGDTVKVVLPAHSITTYRSKYTAVSNEKAHDIPSSIKLKQNYPNPFNPSTLISYQLPVSSQVTLKVYDMVGREVATLMDGRVSAGEHQVNFDASNLSSGVYIYRISAGDFVETRQMVLIK